MPSANFRIIDQCGHMPQEEQPEATMLQIANSWAHRSVNKLSLSLS